MGREQDQASIFACNFEQSYPYFRYDDLGNLGRGDKMLCPGSWATWVVVTNGQKDFNKRRSKVLGEYRICGGFVRAGGLPNDESNFPTESVGHKVLFDFFRDGVYEFLEIKSYGTGKTEAKTTAACGASRHRRHARAFD